ncbi:4Fe-4S dicluster domain-containing protein [bacterium]|nr:4Fe-4S dicluster domain-containing protein [bacterium]
MAHLTVRSAYERLSDRLNRFPQGAPPTDLLFRILATLFSEQEAVLVAQLPIKPFTAADATGIWKRNRADTMRELDALADRGLLVDIIPEQGDTLYCLPPPMAGFFEFSLMRTRGDIDQELLSELFQQYITVEDDFMLALFDGDTQMGRTFVNEKALPDEDGLHVLDWERASEVIRTAKPMAVGMCYCRHKAMHAAEACDAQMDICMTFNTTADSLSRHGIARRIESEEGLDLLQQAYEHNLVQFGENVRDGVNFICNCCGCCCEALIAQRRFSVLKPIHTSRYLPVVDRRNCNGCRKCVNICPVEAMGLVSANDPLKPKKMVARLEDDLCLGCGVCVRVCEEDALRLEPRTERVIPPMNGVHKAVVMALERGKLHNLLFDRRDLVSHRVMGAVFGAILNLPPVKRALCREQVKSRYLEYLVAKAGVEG